MRTLSLTTYNRPYYLQQMLISLRSCDHLNEFDKLVIAVEPSDKFDDTMMVIDTINFIPIEVIINDYIKGVRKNPYDLLEHVFNYSDFNVYLEDDMLISKDALSYAIYTQQFYNHNSLTFCQFYNDESKPEYPDEWEFRKDFRALGFSITRHQWENFFKKYWWEDSHEGIGWDWGIRKGIIEKDIKVLTPKFSRSYHIGEIGIHCDPECYIKLFKYHRWRQN